MVRGDVQRFQIHLNPAFLRDLRTFHQSAEHGAEFYGVREIPVIVDHKAAFSQAIGMDSHTAGACLLGGGNGLFQKFQIICFLGGINEREFRVSVKTGNADARRFRGSLYCVQIFVCPAPEFHKFKTVVFGSLESVQKRNFTVHGFDTGGF